MTRRHIGAPPISITAFDFNSVANCTISMRLLFLCLNNIPGLICFVSLPASSILSTEIEEQHRLLHVAYDRDATIKSALDSESSVHSFEADWVLVEGFGLEVQVLRDFCGGIAAVPANTATVESNFSILGWEKDEYRKCLSDLALGGIMHSKQFELLGNLA